MARKPRKLNSDDCAAVVDICACFNLRRTSRAVTQMFDEALVPVGLRSTQLIVLVAVGAGEPITTTRLCKNLSLDASTLMRSLQPLLRAELVERSQGKDGKRITIMLTDAGRKTIIDALPIWQSTQDALVGRLGQGAWDDLKAKLFDTLAAAKAYFDP